jgi:hypothetical protein
MASTYTVNKSIEKPAYNDYAANPTGWSGPVNTDWDIIDKAFGGVTVKNPTGVSGTVNLVASEYQSAIIVIGVAVSTAATLTANVVYTIPSGVGGVWSVFNNTTGAYTVTFSNLGGGSSVVAVQGIRTLIFSDGTNIRTASDVAPSSIASNTQVIYNNSGALAGSANMTFNGTTLSVNTFQTTVGSITSASSITAAGDVTAYSDARLKTDVETITDALNLVSQMRGVKYTMINTGADGIGVIAQEMQQVVPQVVHDNNGTLSVAYANLVGVLIEAIKELNEKVDRLQR